MPAVTVSSYLARAGTGLDQSAYLQAALDAITTGGGGIVLVDQAGTYDATGLVWPTSVECALVGMPGVVFRKNGGGAATSIITMTGSLGAAVALSADATAGDLTVTVASLPAGLATGSYVMLRDTYVKYTAKGRNEEQNRVVGISGTGPYTVTLANPITASLDLVNGGRQYLVSRTAQLVVASPVIRPVIEQVLFEIPSGTSGGGVYGQYVYRPRIFGCEVTGPNERPAFQFNESAYGLIDECSVRDGQNLSVNGYGFILGESCHHFTIDHATTENVRENSYSDNVRHSKFLNATCRGSYDSAFNTHGTGDEDILAAHLQITDSYGAGLTVGYSSQPSIDVNVTYSDFTIDGTGSAGIAASGNPTGSVMNRRVRLIDGSVRSTNRRVSGQAVLVSYCDDSEIAGVEIDGAGAVNADYGLLWSNSPNGEIDRVKVHDFSKTGATGVGIAGTATVGAVLRASRMWNIAANNVYVPTGGATFVDLVDNDSDDATVSIAAAATRRSFGNVWGTWPGSGAQGFVQTIQVQRTTDGTPVTNSTTLVSDDTLTFGIGANERWRFQCYLLIAADNATMDAKVAIASPTGATVRWGINGLGSEVNGWNARQPSQSQIRMGTEVGGGQNPISVATLANTGPSPTGLLLEGIVTNGATAGNITVEIAQNTLDAGNLTVLAYSLLIADQIA